MSQVPIDPYLMARIDQDSAFLNEMVANVREHRRTECVMANAPCIGDDGLVLLANATRHTLLAMLSVALVRLADLPAPPTTIEGINP